VRSFAPVSFACLCASGVTAVLVSTAAVRAVVSSIIEFLRPVIFCLAA
jgi:hypothetical protein